MRSVGGKIDEKNSMSKNLFTIPPEMAGKILSFLEGKEALIYYSTYKVLNKEENFIPEDYCFTTKVTDSNMWSVEKNIKNLIIDCNVVPYVKYLPLDNFGHLEELKVSGYIHEVKGLEKLINLRSLNIPSLVMGVDSLNKYQKLESYRGELTIRDDEKERLNLRSYRGCINSRIFYSIILNRHFNPDRLEELEVDCFFNRKIFTLDTFVNLKRLTIWTGLGSPSELSTLVNLEELNITFEGEFNCAVLSGMTRLTKLTIKCSTFFNGEQLSDRLLEGLTELSINGLSHESITNRLPIMTKLHTLTLIEPDCSIIKYLPVNLEHLTLSKVSGDVKFFKYIQRLTSLKSLKVSFARGFRSWMMKYISKLHNLEILFLDNPNRFDPRSLSDLTGLFKLKKITVIGNSTKIRHESFTCLSHLQGLEVENLCY
jgi:hypothetical protein